MVHGSLDIYLKVSLLVTYYPSAQNRKNLLELLCFIFAKKTCLLIWYRNHISLLESWYAIYDGWIIGNGTWYCLRNEISFWKRIHSSGKYLFTYKAIIFKMWWKSNISKVTLSTNNRLLKKRKIQSTFKLADTIGDWKHSSDVITGFLTVKPLKTTETLPESVFSLFSYLLSLIRI